MNDSYNSKEKYCCALIGEGNLTLACANFLLGSALTIDTVITNHEKMREWSEKNNIFCISSKSDYSVPLRTRKFHYLICIINESKLSPDIIEQASICSINYHDSPLPHYAGVHATSWAILNNEPSHGITWHVMNHRIDSGDIILNRHFDIGPDETALTLNMKCFEAAITSLPELINKLTAPPLKLVPQEKLLNNFYYKADKPQGNGIITSDMPLTAIQCFMNAAHFGYVDNDFYTPKIKIGCAFYILLDAQCVVSEHTATPGVVMALTSQSMVLSFKEGYLHIKKVANSITALNISELVQQENIYIGMQLLSPDNQELQKYRKIVQKNYHSERIWSCYLKNEWLARLEVNFNNTQLIDTEFLTFSTLSMNLSDSMFITLFCQFMAQRMGQLNIIVPIQHRKPAFDAESEYTPLFLNHSFIYTDLKNLTTIKAINESIQDQLLQLPQIQFDINWRYRDLKKSIILPPLLISLERHICRDSPIVLHYYQNNLKVLFSKDIEMTTSIKDSINTFLEELSLWDLKLNNTPLLA